ncbi:MAG: helix-hairpin-helix domain-containing protein [Gammaproteobacteria bacterium]|nr:helix-hairpin-helix domain-containing protein [Gammaproteobacteria bacterium]
MTAVSVKEFTFTPNGVKIEILSEHDDGEYKMVRSLTTGKVFFAHKNQISEDLVDAPEPTEKPAKQRRGRQIVKPEVQAFNRVNINSATPQLLTQVLKGVGLKTATEIKELQQSMPGERFTKLDQLRSISRVDWDSVLEGDHVYVE